MIDRSPRLHRLARLAMLALFGLLAQIAVACAHASFSSSDPEDGAVVERAPSTYTLSFSEPVSPLTLKLVTPDGASIPLERFKVKDRTVEIVAPADLGRGTHVLTWRVTSADGHPIGGSIVFSIGTATAEPPPIGDEVDAVVRAGVLGSKVALYIGLFIGVGGAFASRWLIDGARRGRNVVMAALGIGIIGTLASLAFQGLDALGAPIALIAEPRVWSTAMATSVGATVSVAAVAIATAVAALLSHGHVSRLLSLVAVILTGAALSLSGHAAAAEPQWLMRTAVFLHAVAITFWVGALAPLGLALRASCSQVESPDVAQMQQKQTVTRTHVSASRLRRGDPAAAAALRRFSTIVPYAVAALVAAGLVLAVVQVREPRALIDTAYGQLLLAKAGLLVGLFLLAAVNRWRLTGPAVAGNGPATSRLVRLVAAETAIVLLIFAIAASWRFTPPPRALAAVAEQAATAHIHTDKAIAFVKAMPGRAGQVDLSVRLLDGKSQALDAKKVTFVLSKPDSGIEPFKRPAEQDAKGDWRNEHMTIPLPGTWHIRIDVLSGDFEMVRLEGQISIRPSASATITATP
ncbi:copper resistance protein CopC [Sinorhizobium saheli]|uniref:Copper resistance protein CopC n=2 Tax=Sinorhizobium saheli TaxID=36856 RepID=A0A178YBX0_SINSA|nr:copper resistance protein CopC [Sinorhizobium saheli]OAP44245.1 copper resistance protein CopC [Sinorhizobium saheli]